MLILDETTVFNSLSKPSAVPMACGYPPWCVSLAESKDLSNIFQSLTFPTAIKRIIFQTMCFL